MKFLIVLSIGLQHSHLHGIKLVFDMMATPTIAQLLLITLIGLHTSLGQDCEAPDTIDYSLSQEYCDQPLFVTFLPRTDEYMLIDNICYTYYPLPDDPNTFTVYQARVFCDGSYDVQTFIGTEFSIGQSQLSNPLVTVRDYFIGYAGCDTYILYRCGLFGDDAPYSFVAGVSPRCNPIGLSCLRKVEEIIDDRGLPESDYYVLPMKLPNRCITQQLCTIPPNPFYNLPSVVRY